jgi:membrane dipeptidase
VVESYGFSPRSAIDGDAIRRAVEAGASAAEVEDLSTDMLLSRVAEDPAQRQEYLEAWRASGVTCVLQNAGEEGNSPLRLLKRLAYLTYLTDVLRGEVSRAATPDDIEAAKKAGRRCLYMTANGVPLRQEWNSAAEELSWIRVFFQLGVRMMHLTYNRRNVLGDGCAEPANAGLSELGRAAIAEMNRVGVIVDVAHSGWRTSLEAAKASTKPMVASHTGAVEVQRHIRAKPDEVLRAICDTGGYAGVYSVTSFLGKAGDINAMLDHIEYLVKKFGAGHVAIGTDIAYIPSAANAEWKKMGPQPKKRPFYEALWPPGALDNRAHPSLAWTNWPMFTVGMVQRGIPDDAIRKILGGNVMRVARAVWAGRG